MNLSVAPTKCSTSTISRFDGHRALGGRNDNRHRGGRHERQNGEAAERKRSGDGADLLLPAAMIVERDAFKVASKSSADFRQVGRLDTIDFNCNQARHGQGLQRI